MLNEFLEGHPSYLSDHNINNTMGIIISSDKKKEMLKFLESNMGKLSQREMARKLGIGKTAVNRWCVDEFGFHPIKHIVNEEFFDNPNEESSYILGFIFADGNVTWNPSRSYWSLTITASSKDKAHLEKIRGLMGSTKPLLYSKNTNSYRLIVASKILCRKLIDLGVVPRKSMIVRFPENITRSDHVRHFIRGIIDGDGTVRYVNRRRSPYFEISICSGSERFLKKLSKVIFNHIGVKSRCRRIHSNTFGLQFSCTRGKCLAHWIYKDSRIYLKRKFANFSNNLNKMEVQENI
ncbi:MAG: LAGLIDADG family homing endonuclease [Candidatus Aenigmatarchaeota archaeon]